MAALVAIAGRDETVDGDAFPGAFPAAQALEARRRWTHDDWVVYGLLTLERVGIHAVRIEEMARRSGRTPGSFYGYFASRDALLEAMAADWKQRRLAQLDWTHRHLKRMGRYTLSGVIEDFRDRVQGQWVRPDLDLAMRVWARHDPRARRAVQACDDCRLTHAMAMVRSERPDAQDAPEIALLLNWILAGRHILFFDPKDATLSRAAAAALDHWAVRAMAPARNDGSSGAASIEDTKPKAPAKRRTRPKVGATRPR
jgi:AcrR family transcriptional regulator